MLGLMQDRPLLLSSLIAHAARFHGRAPIVSIGPDGRAERTDYAGIDANSRRLASVLPGLGLGPGDRIASLAFNTRRHMELFYGIAGAGLVLHTANPRLFADDLAHTINDAEDRVLFVDPDCLAIVEAIRADVPTVERIVVLDTAERAGADSYDALIAAGDPRHPWPTFEERGAASLCYTSGTTGRPKGVLYSHRALVLQAWAVCANDGFQVANTDCILPAAPMFHCSGWSIPYAGAMTGAKLVLPGRDVSAPALCELIARERVTFGLGVPTVWLSVLQHLDELGEHRSGDLASLQRIACGGSAPPLAMMRRLREDFGVETIHAWGMTETSAACTFSHPRPGQDEDRRYATINRQGRPVYGCEIDLVDADGGALAWDDAAIGRLKVRGHWVTSGYFRRDAPLLDNRGWFDTGDIGALDAHGSMRITDRGKDAIKSGGEWISSIELENLAVGHPDVLEAAVIAMPHPKWQERPLLIAVRRPGADLDGEALRDWLRPKLAKWWLPDEVRFVDELPHTATGKIRKTDLRAQFAP